MRRAFLLSFAFMVTATAPLAGTEAVPRFEQCPARPIYSGPTASPVLRRGTEAWRYRTAIREAYQGTRVNFAGHYVAIYWGCGTSCQQWAIVDAQSGSVYMVPFPTGGLAEFRADSRLFIADPAQCNEEQCEGSDALMQLYRGEYAVYYRWNGRRLESVYSVDKSHQPNGSSREQTPSNKPLQPTRAAKPNGQPQAARSDPRG
jgi:hypothetical protein